MRVYNVKRKNTSLFIFYKRMYLQELIFRHPNEIRLDPMIFSEHANLLFFLIEKNFSEHGIPPLK